MLCHAVQFICGNGAGHFIPRRRGRREGRSGIAPRPVRRAEARREEDSGNSSVGFRQPVRFSGRGKPALTGIPLQHRAVAKVGPQPCFEPRTAVPFSAAIVTRGVKAGAVPARTTAEGRISVGTITASHTGNEHAGRRFSHRSAPEAGLCRMTVICRKESRCLCATCYRTAQHNGRKQKKSLKGVCPTGLLHDFAPGKDGRHRRLKNGRPVRSTNRNRR